MNKLDKFILKLDQKNRNVAERTIEMIYSGDLSTLDIKKLKGTDNIYRARIGKIRIFFERKGEKNDLLGISRRNDNTYSGFY